MKPEKIRPRAFEGFARAAFTFLTELEANNDRDWFADNKGRYEALWKTPLEALVDDAGAVLGPGKPFRVHRDVRFSKDKTPYKTHASAVFENEGLVFYLHLEKDHAFCATGMHMMAKDQLARLYRAVDDARAGPALERAVAAAEGAGLEIGGEALKTVARGYPKDHPRVRFLRHKGLTASRTWRWKKQPPPWMRRPEALERFAAAWAEPSAMNAWLMKHVGPSEEGRKFVKGAP